jgi:hypothetical protein
MVYQSSLFIIAENIQNLMIEILERYLNVFSGLSIKAFQLSAKYWQVKTCKKINVYNNFVNN